MGIFGTVGGHCCKWTVVENMEYRWEFNNIIDLGFECDDRRTKSVHLFP